MPINRNLVIAGAAIIIVAAWLLSGLFGRTPEKAVEAAAEPIATQSADGSAADGALFRVRARTLKAEPRAAVLTVRGQTKAERSVEVRSETAGSVAKLHVDKGSVVKAGALICELEADARQAQLDGAMAAKRQAELEMNAALELSKKGYRSETAVAASKAQLDGARAQVRQAQIELERTRLRAPFDGIVDGRHVERGDYMQPGSPCALVVDLDPILVVASISEREVAAVTMGAAGRADLATGEVLEGRVRYVSRAADAQSRTYRVELEVPNPDGSIRDGITADLRLPVSEVLAHRITPAILGLDERGVLGVRIVDAEQKVVFLPVTVIGDDNEGIWVSGLPETATVITVGQEYVVPGQKVEVVFENEVARS